MLVGVGGGLGSDGDAGGVRGGNCTDRWPRLDGRRVFAGQGRGEGGVVPGSRCMGRSRRASRGGGSLVRSLSCGRSFS